MEPLKRSEHRICEQKQTKILQTTDLDFSVLIIQV